MRWASAAPAPSSPCSAATSGCHPGATWHAPGMAWKPGWTLRAAWHPPPHPDNHRIASGDRRRRLPTTGNNAA
ncbi:hypothetical protein G6F46_015168 [Rhizopus delemar]|nr:hypothetical protein G6F59_018074 [Rhizopus arrhizus]KAG1582972.1 hypothetical protein G6F46_015168 [Rhizopus delemar]